MTEPVIVPAARVVLKPLLFAFGVLAGYFVAFGLVFCMDAIVRAFFGTVSGAVGWIPFAGKVLTKPLTTIERHLTSYLGGLEAHFERQMAIRWHLLASLVSQLAADTRAAAIYDWQLARKFATLWGNAAIGAVVKGVHAAVKVVHAQVHALTPKVIYVQKLVGSKADAFVHRLVRVLQGEIAHVIDWSIPRLRARDRALSDSLGRLWHRVRAERHALGIGAFTGLLVMALGRLGLGWMRCKGFTKLGKRACGMNPSLLEALLADTLLIAGTISIVELARELQRITPTVTDAISGVIREAS